MRNLNDSAIGRSKGSNVQPPKKIFHGVIGSSPPPQASGTAQACYTRSRLFSATLSGVWKRWELPIQNWTNCFKERSESKTLSSPLRAFITAGVLTAGLISFRQGNSHLGQQLMRARVVVQGATVALMDAMFSKQ
ncbi:unnamed protein product [Camellia sinensis]